MYVITFFERKGGIGRTTSTLNIAHTLAEQGFKVCVVDTDEQSNASRSISSIVDSNLTIEDVLVNDEISLSDAAMETNWSNVWICPASPNLSGTIKHLDNEIGSHLILKEKIDSKFDFILIDTSPSLNILTLNALCASTHMFVPLSSKFFALQGLSQTMSTFKKVQSRLNPDLQLLGIAFVNHDARSVLANEVVQQVVEMYPRTIFKTMIGVNIKIEESLVKQQSILTYASNDRGAEQYRELGREILNRISSKVTV